MTKPETGSSALTIDLDQIAHCEVLAKQAYAILGALYELFSRTQSVSEEQKQTLLLLVYDILEDASHRIYPSKNRESG